MILDLFATVCQSEPALSVIDTTGTQSAVEDRKLSIVSFEPPGRGNCVTFSERGSDRPKWPNLDRLTLFSVYGCAWI